MRSRGLNWGALPALVWAIATTAHGDDIADFQREFDAARREILRDESLWVASPHAEGEQLRAQKHLRTLLNGSWAAWNLPRYPRSLHHILFVAGGTAEGEPWLAFGRFSSEGVELVSVYRLGRDYSDATRLVENRTLWSREPLQIEFLANERRAGDVVSVLRIEGSINRIAWKFGKPRDPQELVRRPAIMIHGGRAPTTIASSMRPLRNVIGARWTGIEAEPQTGWLNRRDITDDDLFAPSANWWPETDGMRYFDDKTPSQEFDVDGPKGVGFLHDRDLIAVSDSDVYRIDIGSGRVNRTKWFTDEGRTELDTVVFSSDGTRLAVTSTSGTAYFVDVETVTTRRRYSPLIRDSLCFFDRDTLLARTGDQLISIDWNTKDWMPLPFPREVPYRFSVVGDKMVTDRGAEWKLRLLDLRTDETLATFPAKIWEEFSLSPDSRHLVQIPSGIRITEVATGRRLWDIEHCSDLSNFHWTSNVKWTPDGRYGVLAGDSYVYIWRIDERWVKRIKHGRIGRFVDVDVSSDGRRLAVAARDSKIAYWANLPNPTPEERAAQHDAGPSFRFWPELARP